MLSESVQADHVRLVIASGRGQKICGHRCSTSAVPGLIGAPYAGTLTQVR
jgi:hypothetical protein